MKNINTYNELGETLLMIASQGKGTDIVELLLNNGADVNASSDSGTALFNIVTRSNFLYCDEGTALVKLLMSKSVGIDIPNSEGKTPIMESISEGCLDVFKLLLANGADINAHDKEGRNALYIAITEKEYDILKLLLKNRVIFSLPRLQETDSEYGSLLNSLCWQGILLGYPDKVKNGCEQAVKLKPDNGDTRDSRGLVRALTNDINGAIEDFEAYVNWLNTGKGIASEKTRAQRESWIKDLRAEKNPFTPELLSTLRKGSEGYWSYK